LSSTTITGSIDCSNIPINDIGVISGRVELQNCEWHVHWQTYRFHPVFALCESLWLLRISPIIAGDYLANLLHVNSAGLAWKKQNNSNRSLKIDGQTSRWCDW
ncbi:MAG: hypothetical protein QF590_03200, partial [Dehalococcoidia bacterium]|nr:hypothetical protein [Dehalococcoidia bacterium]